LVLLGGVAFALPPGPGLVSGGPVSLGTGRGLSLGTPAAGPRGGAFVSRPDPVARPVVLIAQPQAAAAVIVDSYELVVFAKNRPLRIHVSAGAEGKPMAERWREALKAAFNFFDRDGDGYLNGYEVRFIFSDEGLKRLTENGLYSPIPQDQPTLDRLDRDGDRRVSFDEFVAYYRQSTGFVIRGQPPQPEASNNPQITEALFKLLDRNGDGKLTRDEVMAAERLIPSLDADEDECLSLAELVPGLGGPNQGRLQPVPRAGPGPGPGSQPVPTLMALYETGKIPGSVTQRILMEYDKDGDFELTAAESGFDPKTFARLDTDGNGKLSGEELDAWRSGPADLDVSLSLSPNPGASRAKAITDRDAAAAAGLAIRQPDPERVIVQSGRQVIELWAFAGGAQLGRVATLKQQFIPLYLQAAGSKGYVEERDLYGPMGPQLQFIKVAFDPADRNGDGKLTQKELEDYLDLQQSFLNLSLSLTPTLQTPSLFDLLDENRDGKLSVRELRTAWDRLIALEPDSKTEVTRTIIQPAVSLRLTRLAERFLPGQQVVAVRVGPRDGPQAAPTRGPVWFRKMDRNGDGDVSRSEFLGTQEEFDAIDTDHDGLISLEEAEAYDRKMREKK
jgi:Ca2+-binding EF-hand superfamily protein